MKCLYIFEIGGWVINFHTMMGCYKGDEYPLRYDSEGDLFDFFDYDGYESWIDLGEEVLMAYKSYTAEQIILG